MRFSHTQGTFRRRRVERTSVVRRQGGMARTRAEEWLDEFEITHVSYLVVEYSNAEGEDRGSALVARGLPMRASTRGASAGATQAPSVQL